MDKILKLFGTKIPTTAATSVSEKSAAESRFQLAFSKIKRLNNEGKQLNVLNLDEKLTQTRSESMELITRSTSAQSISSKSDSCIIPHAHYDLYPIYKELKKHLHELTHDYELEFEGKPINLDSFECGLNKLVQSFIPKLLKCEHLADSIMSNAYKYDYDVNVRKNGYRTLIKAFDKCCHNTLALLKELNLNKSTFLYQMKTKYMQQSFSNIIKELETYLKLFENFEYLLEIAVDMQRLTNDNQSLFLNEKYINFELERKLLLASMQNPEAYFGRSCAFQFSNSLKIPLTGCAIALASYNDGYEAFQNNLLGKTAKILFSSSKYVINPELRAEKLADIMKNANVEFCKAFWQLTETPLVHMSSNFITPNLSVNVVKALDPIDLQMEMINGDNILVKAPFQKNELSIRVLSAEFREGMHDLDNQLLITCLNTGSRSIQTRSPNLILHAHGGGFIAHSSKSHEIYLKTWCKDLNVPIVSIDYSLAPEHPFPKSSEECFYVYVWCLLNKDSLGWTGERIVLVGDSAGGVLVTNITQRAIQAQIRVPDALVPIYAPFLLAYSLSPSRLLSVMDPLLNLGILWRCLAAYCGIDLKMIENVPEDMKREAIEKMDSDENHETIHTKIAQIEELRKIVGNSIYLIQVLRNHPLSDNMFMSPLLTCDEVIKKFPKTFLVICDDCFMDDGLEFGKLLTRNQVVHESLIIDNGACHGFLNMTSLTTETHEANAKVFDLLARLLVSKPKQNQTIVY